MSVDCQPAMVTSGNEQNRGLQIDSGADVRWDDRKPVTNPGARSIWMRPHGVLLAEAGHGDVLMTKHQAVAIESGNAQVR